VPASSPRIPLRLLDVVDRLAPARVPIAEINRLVGGEAERMGLARPSYESIRLLVHSARRLQALEPTTLAVAADVLLRARPPQALVDRFGEPLRPRLRDLRGSQQERK
jgi:hypothetical protein